MEFGEMKRNTSSRIGAIFASFCVTRVCQRQLGFLFVFPPLVWRPRSGEPVRIAG